MDFQEAYPDTSSSVAAAAVSGNTKLLKRLIESGTILHVLIVAPLVELFSLILHKCELNLSLKICQCYASVSFSEISQYQLVSVWQQ